MTILSETKEFQGQVRNILIEKLTQGKGEIDQFTAEELNACY